MLTEKTTSVTTNAAVTVGAVTAGAGALTLSDWALIIGIIGTIATVIMNWFFQARRLRVDEHHKRWIRENSPVLIDRDAGTDES